MGTIKNVPGSPVVLIILDGFGINPNKTNNAIALANTPKLDKLFANNAYAVIQASGKASGLPDGQMGNSEVGHMTMGCGSIIRQNLVIIDEAISDGSFNKNKVLLKALSKAAKKNNQIHITGLVSNGGVHSHINHLLALINLCIRNSVFVNIHMITDGRDTAPQSALKFCEMIENSLTPETGRIASVSGRYYAMDRDNRWERTQKAWECMVNGKGKKADSASEAITQAYENGTDDEFIKPTFITGSQTMSSGDPVIFINFRKDRPRQIVAALSKKDFVEFERKNYKPVDVVCFTQYDEWFQLPFAFENDKPAVTLAEIISNEGIQQLHCAETEKYAHVTYFFNGGIGECYPGEERILIDSSKVATYDEKPEMSAEEVADAVIESMKCEKYGFIVVNFANGDMVGHTAVRESVIKAVEALDKYVGRVVKAARKNNYSVIVTADHGNCDEMVDPVTGEPHTQHTVYPVPCLIVDDTPRRLSTEGGLKNIAPTVLQLMGLTRPEEMQGRSLILGPAGQ